MSSAHQVAVRVDHIERRRRRSSACRAARRSRPDRRGHAPMRVAQICLPVSSSSAMTYWPSRAIAHRVDAAAGDRDAREAAAEPGRRYSFWRAAGRPARQQARFGRDAVALRSPPLRPVAARRVGPDAATRRGEQDGMLNPASHGPPKNRARMNPPPGVPGRTLARRGGDGTIIV